MGDSLVLCVDRQSLPIYEVLTGLSEGQGTRTAFLHALLRYDILYKAHELCFSVRNKRTQEASLEVSACFHGGFTWRGWAAPWSIQEILPSHTRTPVPRKLPSLPPVPIQAISLGSPSSPWDPTPEDLWPECSLKRT